MGRLIMLHLNGAPRDEQTVERAYFHDEWGGGAGGSSDRPCIPAYNGSNTCRAASACFRYNSGIKNSSLCSSALSDTNHTRPLTNTCIRRRNTTANLPLRTWTLKTELFPQA